MPAPYPIVLAPGISFLVTFAAIAWMLTRAGDRLPLDRPNERSLHSTPVPRTGGVGIMAGAVAGAALATPGWWWLLALCGGLALISFLDDMQGLAVVWRLAAHFTAALLFAAAALPDTSFPWLALAVVAVMWTTNLFNFMDGADGLAGGMALAGFGFYGVAWWLGGSLTLASASFCVAAAAAAFLRFNFHPARIFMGDAGSVPLGFLAAALGIIGWQRGDWPLWFPALVFSPFVVDATATLLRRLARGEKLWLAHREHYYQRLVRMGFGHRNTALAEYAVMVAAGAAAIWGIGQGPMLQLWVCAGWVALYGLLMVLVDRSWSRHQAIERDSGRP